MRARRDDPKSSQHKLESQVGRPEFGKWIPF
jgi:hypothetical protein